MKSIFSNEWLNYMLRRAIKTFVQVFLALIITMFIFVQGVFWGFAFAVSILSMIFSIITSLFGIPECTFDGSLQVDNSHPEKDIFLLALNIDVDDIPNKKIVILKVETNSQKKPMV